MKIEDLYIYPIKSTNGFKVTTTTVLSIGFENDRYYGIINSKNELLTAREKPELLKINSTIDGNTLKLTYQNSSFNTPLNSRLNKIDVSLFKNSTTAILSHLETDKWLSTVLKDTCRLVFIDIENLRSSNLHSISFNDVAPIHLITTESVNYLNSKLEEPVNKNRFRANIVLSGTQPFEEENWSSINIGECEFKVISKTQRCSLITIDPNSALKHKKQEPLRTLAKEFLNKGSANFGIYLVPIKLGKIKHTDTVRVTLKS